MQANVDYIQIIRNAKKCDFSEEYVYIHCHKNLIDFKCDWNGLQEQELLKKPDNQLKVLKLASASSEIRLICEDVLGNEPTAFFKKQPLFGDFLIFALWSEPLKIENIGGLTLSQAFGALSKLQIPNLQTKIIRVHPPV